MIVTNELGLPQPFVDAATSDYTYTDKRYSATAILKGVREAVLLRRHADEIAVDVADSVWLVFGKAVHSILENSQELPEQIKECRLEEELPCGYTLSGIFDLYDATTQTVVDYKTASVWKAIYGEWDDYRRQLAIYAWLLEKAGFPCRRGEVVALLKDHSKTEAARNADYPRHPVVKVAFDFSDADLAETEKFILGRFDEIIAAEQLADDDLPLCSEEERWHKPDKWAAKKPQNKKATKLFDNEADATAFATASGLVVEHRPGEDSKCAKYCNAAPFCSHAKSIGVA